MGIPQGRRSRTRVRRRRAEIMKLSTANLALCPKCHQPKQAHRVCPACGYYKNREVITPQAQA